MKKKYTLLTLLALIAMIGFLGFSYPTEKLLAPEVLATKIKDPKSVKPLILNVGPSPYIKGSTYIGNAEDPANKERLRNTLKNYPKNKEVIIYCGCCKLEDCWNIAEADKVITSMGFTNYKILNLPTDFTKDWLEKGYPLE